MPREPDGEPPELGEVVELDDDELDDDELDEDELAEESGDVDDLTKSAGGVGLGGSTSVFEREESASRFIRSLLKRIASEAQGSERFDGDAPDDNFVMQVGASRQPRAAHHTDRLARAHQISLFYHETLEVRIAGRNPEVVANFDHITEATVAAGKGDTARLRRENFARAVSHEIHPFVVLQRAVDRMAPEPER